QDSIGYDQAVSNNIVVGTIVIHHASPGCLTAVDVKDISSYIKRQGSVTDSERHHVLKKDWNPLA
ncbi:hypothetical protein MAR_025635, partial [Mya arenaria]